MRRAELFREEVAGVGEGFELEGVAGGVEEEHGGLFAELAFEADLGLDDEGDVGGAEAGGERLQSEGVRTTPKWGTGTSWPSTGLLSAALRLRGAADGLRCATIWWP